MGEPHFTGPIKDTPISRLVNLGGTCPAFDFQSQMSFGQVSWLAYGEFRSIGDELSKLYIA